MKASSNNELSNHEGIFSKFGSYELKDELTLILPNNTITLHEMSNGKFLYHRVSQNEVIKKIIQSGSSQIKVATFMPKPIYGDNASAMHVHHSLISRDENLFYDPNDQIANLSQMGRYYIGGLLDHASSLCAISNPTTNSYKRLVPGFEAPIGICWGQ